MRRMKPVLLYNCTFAVIHPPAMKADRSCYGAFAVEAALACASSAGPPKCVKRDRSRNTGAAQLSSMSHCINIYLGCSANSLSIQKISFQHFIHD
jgi:hypothetical protein